MIEIILLGIPSGCLFFLLGLKIIDYYFYLEDKKEFERDLKKLGKIMKENGLKFECPDIKKNKEVIKYLNELFGLKENKQPKGRVVYEFGIPVFKPDKLNN